jgi:hypothetical protein
MNEDKDEGNLFAKLEGSMNKGAGKKHNQTYNFNAIEQLDMDDPNPVAATRYIG